MFLNCFTFNGVIRYAKITQPSRYKSIYMYSFDVHRAVHRNIISIVKPTRCTNVSNLFYFGITLHISVNKNPTRCNSMQIFIYCKATLHVSVVTAPIIRSTKNCNRSLRYRSYYWYSYFPPTRSDQATLEGSSCTIIMNFTSGCGYSF